MGVLLQPDGSLALQLKYEAASNHFGTFSGLDSILAQSHGMRSKGDKHRFYIS